MAFQLQRTYGLNSDYWYQSEAQLSLPSANLFMKMDPDSQTQEFLDQSATISNNYFWQTIRNLGVMILSTFYSKTDINGLTGFGNMFLFSDQQIGKLLNIDAANWNSQNKTVLDLGAGNGDITQRLTTFYSNVYATELSPRMRSRLSSKGFKLLDALEWSQTDIKFDLITAFNLLDRHYSPQKMLADLWKVASKSNCNVIISLVLPVNHYVEYNPNGTSTRPEQFLKVSGRTFAEHANSLIANEFQPANFEVLKWTRLPYLCEGDMAHAAYYLPDAMFLLKPLPKPQQDSAPEPSHTTTTVHNEL